MVLTRLYRLTGGSATVHFVWLEFFDYSRLKTREIESMIADKLDEIAPEPEVRRTVVFCDLSEYGTGLGMIQETIERPYRYSWSDEAGLPTYQLHRVSNDRDFVDDRRL